MPLPAALQLHDWHSPPFPHCVVKLKMHWVQQVICAYLAAVSHVLLTVPSEKLARLSMRVTVGDVLADVMLAAAQTFGSVEVPQEAFVSVLSMNADAK